MQVCMKIAQTFQAVLNCEKSGNVEWERKHAEKIEKIVRNYLPSGSGFDKGAMFLMDESTPEKLVFRADYHHMNGQGMYDGWTEHRITVRPSLVFGFTVTVSGRNRNGIKEYISEFFDACLSANYVEGKE